MTRRKTNDFYRTTNYFRDCWEEPSLDRSGYNNNNMYLCYFDEITVKTIKIVLEWNKTYNNS